jgi:NADH-quinone oxidoreductase subunit H
MDSLTHLVRQIPPWLIILLVVHGVVLGTVAYLILLERKVASWVQDRIGPNRTGLGFGLIPFLKDKKMFGLGQPLADGMKFIFKEDYRPKGVDKYLFTLAPMMMIIPIIVSIAVIPWGGTKVNTVQVTVPAGATTEQVVQAARDVIPWYASVVGTPVVEGTTATVTYGWLFQIAQLNVGVLFVLAILSLAVYGVVIGGWASNNKYSFLGGLRATVNMISYEIPLGLAVLTTVLMFGTLDLGTIVEKQVHYWFGFLPAWNVFAHPLAFTMFLICIHAEANRAPFDLAEAEQELVGGYHTEYSSMRFALFFLAEYAGMVTTSAVCTALFFGGWHIPWLDLIIPSLSQAHGTIGWSDSILICVVRAAFFFAKTLFVLFVFMWVRWSIPRYRFDQLMMLAWRALIPMALLIMIVTALAIYYVGPHDALFMTSTRIGNPLFVTLLAANVATTAAIMFASTLVPAAPPTNRRVRIAGSRFNTTALPAGTQAT